MSDTDPDLLMTRLLGSTRWDAASLLSAWRRERGWTSCEAARSLSAPASQYRSWEVGDVAPPIETWGILARRLELPLTDVLISLGLADAGRSRVDLGTKGQLASSLRTWRLSEGYSQRRAGEIFGVSKGAVERWEDGAVPSPKQIVKLADAWGVTPEEVRHSAGEDRVRRAETSGGQDSTAVALARLHAGLSQAELARRLFVSAAALSRWECGETRPHSDDVKRIAAVLGVTASEADALFATSPPRARASVGRLPGLRDVLATFDMDEVAVAQVAGVRLDRARRWLRATAPLPARVLDLLSTELGVDLHERLDDLRAAPPELSTPRLSTSPIRVRRLELGLDQRQLAQRAGVSASTVSGWELGTRPRESSLGVLARALSWDIGTLRRVLGMESVVPVDLRLHGPSELPTVLSALRRSTGLSQAQLGRVVGVTSVSVRRWESGRARPSGRNLRRLAAAYRVDYTELARLVQRRSSPTQHSREVLIGMAG